ncbi:serine hydrolase domain-containing protein [Plantactinospora sonchi]|uniref:Serine hydrolase domain-containing protein n=1 Tax=Plantactinospora sonchi TaxID=1544735 RepID=A0ABU7RLI4_9ACTN
MPNPPAVSGSVLVMRGESVLLETHHGLADATAGTPCSARTRFQLASVSKQITATAVLQLVERGALGLDDPLDRWFAGSPESWRGITTHHLLAHTSGIGHWREYPMLDLTAPMDPDELLRVFADVPPLFVAGAGWHYSSPGFVLLAHLVQRAADEPYRDYLDRMVFTPLGMTRTFAGMPHGRDDLARGYLDDEPVRSFELDVVGMGAGDVWSTVGDMQTWLAAVRPDGDGDSRSAGHPLGPETRRLMVARHAATGRGTDESGYGYGWFLGSLAGEEWVHHSGENAGFRAFDAWSARSDRRVVMLSNQDRTDATAVTAILTGTAGH